MNVLSGYYDLSLLILRLTIAAIFLVHGPKKLQGTHGGFMTFIGVAETLGGIAILIGFLTQMAALGLAIIMIGATYKKITEWHIPFAAKNTTGWEFDLMILAGCIVLMTMGSGAYGLMW